LIDIVSSLYDSDGVDDGSDDGSEDGADEVPSGERLDGIVMDDRSSPCSARTAMT
jgi:hypothetical protein